MDSTTPTTALTARPATPDDVAALVDIGSAADVAWWGEADTDGDEVRLLLDLAGDLAASTRVLLDGSKVVAMGAVLTHGTTSLMVDPRVAGQVQAAAYDELLPWLAQAGGDQVEAPGQDEARLAHLARHGWGRARSSFELELSADAVVPAPEWPAGVALAAFDAQRDAEAVHTLVYSVWTDVPGHHHRPLAEWQRIFLEHETFDDSLVVVAHRDGAVLGVAICRTYPNDVGWVSQLAVGRDARGLGLGRALLCEALSRLRATGVRTTGLSVEAANASALGLYRSVGLDVTREWVACTRTRMSHLP